MSGVQHGCPLGPFELSLILKRLPDAVTQMSLELSLKMWYLDDGHLKKQL